MLVSFHCILGVLHSLNLNSRVLKLLFVSYWKAMVSEVQDCRKINSVFLRTRQKTIIE